MSRAKFLVGTGIILAALGFLLIRGLQGSMMTYVEVHQLLSEPRFRGSQGMQVVGIVQPGSVKTSGGGKHLAFVLQDMKDQGSTVPVTYSGIIPDNFKPGLQVIVQGRLNRAGHLEAEKILVKCPSKYEASVEHPAKESSDD